MSGKRLILWLTILLVICVPYAILGKSWGRESLRGLKVVHVAVAIAEFSSLSKEKLKTMAELRLRTVGIRVVEEGESRNIPGCPWLYVTVDLMELKKSKGVVFITTVGLKEGIIIINRPINTLACTWENGAFGTSPPGDFTTIYHQISDLIDSFINDYLAENPK